MEENIENLELGEDRLIIVGDFNVRIGEEQGIVECGFGMNTEILERKSEDKQIGSEGKRLLNWCEENTMLIMNGRTKEDILKMHEEMKYPEWFKGLRVTAQEGSDHLPVIVRLE